MPTARMVGAEGNGGNGGSVHPRPVGRRGRLRVARLLVAVGLVTVVSLCATAGASAKVPASFFGVVPWLSFGGQDYERLDFAKIHNARTPFYWPAIEPEHNRFNWVATDAFVGQLAQDHVRVLPFLNGSPSYVAGDPRKAPVKTKQAKKAWKQFVKACVHRYGRHGKYWRMHPELPRVPIKTWQIWNEQNSSAYFKPRPKPKAYAKLLRLAARAAHSKDRKAKIVLGGMFGDPEPRHSMKAPTFLDKLYKVKGAKRSFNAVAVHPYAPTMQKMRKQLERLRKVIVKHHDSHTSMWITEMGWGSAHPSRKWPLLKGKKGQAKILKKSFHLLLNKRKDLNIDRVYWFLWRDAAPDSPVNCSFCKSAGLFHSDETPKPAWKAFWHITRRAHGQ
jgi:Glycosyl hydrolase catalytic core